MSETKQEWLQRVADVHGLDPEDIDEIAELCLDDTETNINTLRKAQRGTDLSEVIRAAHSIKGAAANIHQNKLSDAAKVVENQLRSDDFTNLEANIQALENTYIEFKNFFNS